MEIDEATRGDPPPPHQKKNKNKKKNPRASVDIMITHNTQ